MESYVKGKIPQIIFGSKSAQKVSGLLKKHEIKNVCLLQDITLSDILLPKM